MPSRIAPVPGKADTRRTCAGVTAGIFWLKNRDPQHITFLLRGRSVGHPHFSGVTSIVACSRAHWLLTIKRQTLIRCIRVSPREVRAK